MKKICHGLLAFLLVELVSAGCRDRALPSVLLPAAPSDLTATAVSNRSIDLAWRDGSDNEEGFRIERSEDGSTFSPIETLTVNVAAHTDTGLNPARKYYYRVCAFNRAGDSAYSNAADALTHVTPVIAPSAPSNLAATSVSSTRIDLAWSDNSNSEDGFVIERSSTDDSGFVQIGSAGVDSPVYQDFNLTPATLYYYRVQAYNVAGNSSYSNTTNATTQPPSSDASLASLFISNGALNPSFAPNVRTYNAMFVGQASVSITPTASDAGASISVNGMTVPSGQLSSSLGLDPGSNTLTIVVTAQDRVTTNTYTVTANRLFQEAYIKASDRGGLGNSMALSSDTLAAGAAEAVYVFTKTGATWTQQAYIQAPDPGAGDAFGFSVALSGDTLAVGAIYEDSNSTGINGDQTDNSAVSSGAVYVFKRTGTAWAQEAYIKASDTEARALFGYSLALSGDTLVVGSIYKDSSTVDSGAVYVFTRAGSTWTQQAYLVPSNPDFSGYAEQYGYFGCSVALSEDTLAVGAYGERACHGRGCWASTGSTTAGSVYVFKRTATPWSTYWSQQARIRAAYPDDLDLFGWSVALSGNTLAVGAPNHVNTGGVFVFTRAGTIWTQQSHISSLSPGLFDSFGASLALSGDALAVGAVKEDSGAVGIGGDQADESASNSGAAYVFMRAGATWTKQAYIKSSNSEAGDAFGASVVLSGDTLVVGAPGEDSNAVGIGGDQADNSAVNSGAIYVFH